MTDKKLKLPEAGQWPDKLVVPALIAGAVLSTIGFLMAFFYVAPVGGAAVNGAELIGDVMVSQKMLLSQKIFYFHMPVAITSFLALGFGCYYAVRFLMTKNQRFDTCSRICLEVALLFVVLTMITGEMWTRFEWGVWWSWEPRLTTYLILMLIVIAYFVLRSSVDEPERRATFAAVVAIIATIDVPICFMITRLIPSSIHPVVLREGGMSPRDGHVRGPVRLSACCSWASCCTARASIRCVSPSALKRSKRPSTTNVSPCHPERAKRVEGSRAAVGARCASESMAASDVAFLAPELVSEAEGPVPVPAPAEGRLGYRFVKRVFDIAFSLCATIVGLVPIALLCVAIGLESPGSPDLPPKARRVSRKAATHLQAAYHGGRLRRC